MIEISHLYAGYSAQPVLKDITLTIPPRQLTAIVGPNGCGKSTLLKTLCGILPLQKGEITINGQPVSSCPPKLLAQQVAYLAQSRRVPDMTVEQMVLHGRFPYLSYPRRYRPEDRSIARDAMERMGVSDLSKAMLPTLSGGMRQKVYLAMALAQNTPVVVLDEPTTYLDAAHQLHLMEQARTLCQEGKTVVMVLHDLSQALRTADCMAVLSGGQLAAQGSPDEIFRSGCLDRVFGVGFGRVETPDGPRYYCYLAEKYS